MKKRLFNGHRVNQAFIRFVNDREVNAVTVEQLVWKVKDDPSILWRVPACGESVRRRVIELISPYLSA